MQVIKKNLLNVLFLSLILLFTGCTTSSVYNYSSSNKVLFLGNKKTQVFNIPLTNPIMQYHTSFNCVRESYTLNDLNKNYGRLFVEYIDLDYSCSWTGLPSSFFETNLRYELKIDTLEVVENFDIGSYNFKTYKIDNDSYLSMIYIFGSTTQKFILDYNGSLYDKLLKSFKPDYENRYIFKKRFFGNYNDSLVRKNIINHYFRQESFNVRTSIGINISL